MGAVKHEDVSVEAVDAAMAELVEALLTMGKVRYTLRMRGVRLFPESRLQQVLDAISGAYNVLLQMQQKQ